VMALELFLKDGELLANEFAPRVHNSGHWSIDGAETSQFENHLRAICEMPLGETKSSMHALMFNLLGEMPDFAPRHSTNEHDKPGPHWHDYQKTARDGRKIGHVTVTAESQGELWAKSVELAGELGVAAEVDLESLTRNTSGVV
jgi:5-(carboxyamino)imidazole ribonucleotide synthase